MCVCVCVTAKAIQIDYGNGMTRVAELRSRAYTRRGLEMGERERQESGALT